MPVDSAEFETNEREYDARTKPYFDGTPQEAENLARVGVLVTEGHRLAEAIADVPATTLEGLRAKASALLSYSTAGDGSWANHDELLGYSLARDLLGRA